MKNAYLPEVPEVIILKEVDFWLVELYMIIQIMIIDVTTDKPDVHLYGLLTKIFF